MSLTIQGCRWNNYIPALIHPFETRNCATEKHRLQPRNPCQSRVAKPLAIEDETRQVVT